jgi:hypothetical protein
LSLFSDLKDDVSRDLKDVYNYMASDKIPAGEKLKSLALFGGCALTALAGPALAAGATIAAQGALATIFTAAGTGALATLTTPLSIGMMQEGAAQMREDQAAAQRKQAPSQPV